jgi:spore maturation protein CgeB
MRLVVFGLSISSSWGNGHATTYRALLRAFAERDHDVAFFEWDAPWYREERRDLPAPGFCRLHLYADWDRAAQRALAEAAEADAVLVGSFVREGPRVIDALLEGGIEPLFYDIDTPVTVAQLRRGEHVSLRADQVPLFRSYLSFTGGPFLERVIAGDLGAREARPLYCCVDESAYRPVDADPVLRADLAYMGTYAADRQPGLENLLLGAARRLPQRRFLVAGPQYPHDIAWPGNVARIDHLPPARHPAFYSSAAWQLNLTREEMRRAGWSPSVRLFEAAACGAALISDSWPGLEEFFTPGEEILLPGSREEVVEILEQTHPDDRRALGAAARARVLAEHTAPRRALELEAAAGAGSAALAGEEG